MGPVLTTMTRHLPMSIRPSGRGTRGKLPESAPVVPDDNGDVAADPDLTTPDRPFGESHRTNRYGGGPVGVFSDNPAIIAPELGRYSMRLHRLTRPDLVPSSYSVHAEYGPRNP